MNFNEFIGLEYKHQGRGPRFDCYGLYKHIFKVKRDIELPNFLLDYSIDWFKHGKNYIEENLWDVWEEVQYPFKIYDALLFYYGSSKIANHIGMWIAEDKVLHIPENSTSLVTRYSLTLEP